jgi:hypothetical protein
MSSPSARSEARRKAILARGTDRLSKLTASARPDDPVYISDDPPLASLTSGIPSSSIDEPFRTAILSEHGAQSDFSSLWSEQQQQQLLAALMGTTPTPESPMLSPALMKELAVNSQDPSLSQDPHPHSQSQNVHNLTESPRPTLLSSRVLPLLHILSMWLLLGYYVLQTSMHTLTAEHGWSNWMSRWGELNDRASLEGVSSHLGASFLPFFWVFTSLELGLHASRIFFGYDTLQLPSLLSLVLPSLPQSISSIIIMVLKYSRMLSLFLDDIAILLVGLGLFISFSAWFV